MNLNELTNLLDNLLINIVTDDQLIKKILHLMFEAAEQGINDLTYYFQDTTKIENVKQHLLAYFPDIHIHHKPNTNFIFIDWS